MSLLAPRGLRYRIELTSSLWKLSSPFRVSMSWISARLRFVSFYFRQWWGRFHGLVNERRPVGRVRGQEQGGGGGGEWRATSKLPRDEVREVVSSSLPPSSHSPIQLRRYPLLPRNSPPSQNSLANHVPARTTAGRRINAKGDVDHALRCTRALATAARTATTVSHATMRLRARRRRGTGLTDRAKACTLFE